MMVIQILSRLKKTIASCFAAVDHIDGAGLVILKDKEAVTQQIHLHCRFCRCHHINTELFGLDDLAGVAIFLTDSRSKQIRVDVEGNILYLKSDLICLLALMLLDLTLDILQRSVKGLA